jgi:hypothetical protein
VQQEANVRCLAGRGLPQVDPRGRHARAAAFLDPEHEDATMNKLTRRLLGSTTVAGLATLAPLSLDPGAAAAGEAPVRLTAACGQATYCVRMSGYICSTLFEDYFGYMCMVGCGS